ncbi:MAG: DUF123 domain-containing protein [Nevskiales bacterium]|nr:DUF123 domain-containing protein [Nevskiales bacterium]
MKAAPGTYALVLRSRRRTEIEVGCWGRLRLVPGYYLYVGSAFGPGGVRARVSRHFRETKRHRWHIDFLRACTEPVCAWCSYLPDRLEHDWARALGRMAGASCIHGFGSSDCGCDGHLFVSARMPGRAEMTAALGPSIERCDYRRPESGVSPAPASSPMNAGSGSVADLKGLGPSSAAALRNIGIDNADQLRGSDPFALYAALKAKAPGTSLNFLYALIGAIDGIHWLEVKRSRRMEILLRLDAMGLAPLVRRAHR